MEDALRILNDGTTEKVCASKLHEKDKPDIFICPDCSTYVELRIGQDMKYFAHQRNEVKRLNRQNCPRYCEGNNSPVSYYEISNITGFTLLIDTKTDIKKLAIILPKISDSDIGQDISKIKKIRIFSSAGQAFVDIVDLQYTDVACKLNFYGYEYICEFIDSHGRTIIDKKSCYLRKTIGLDKESGVLFHDNKNDNCRRILPGSQIKVGKTYLYITPYNLQSIPKDIEHERLGDISLNDSITSATRWRITRIKAIRLNADISNFFRNRLRLELVNNESRLDYIWPPGQSNNTTIRTMSKASCILAYRNYGEDYERVYQIGHPNQNRIELNLNKLKETFSLLETSSFNNKAFYQIRGRTTPSVLEIIGDQQFNTINFEKGFLQYENGEVLTPTEHSSVKNSIFFVGKTTPDLIHLQNGVVKNVYKRKIDKLCPTDKLIMDNKAWGIIEYLFNTKVTVQSAVNFEKQLEKIIAVKTCRPDEYIQMPIWVKEIISDFKNNKKVNGRINIIFSNWLSNNEIPNTTLPLFKELFWGVKGNVYIRL